MDDEKIVGLRVKTKVPEHVIDALNATLNDLASVGLVEDAGDDGWEWDRG